MTWATARATLWTFIMMHFTSLPSDISMQCTSVEAWAETTSWNNGSHVARTGGLDSALTSVKRSAVIYQGNIVTYVPNLAPHWLKTSFSSFSSLYILKYQVDAFK